METILPSKRLHAAGPELESHLGYWLRSVSNHVSGAFAKGLQAKHTSVAEWVVLCLVQKQPGVTPGKLADGLNLTRGAISKVIDKLEAKDWVACTTRPEDSRVRSLSLTRAGSRILPRLAEIADENDRKFFGGLDKSERATLQRLLVKLAELHHIRNIPIE